MAKQAKRAKPVQLALPGFYPVQRKPWSVAGCSDRLQAVYPFEHSSWRNMVYRCENPSNSDFENYGGKGVKVCPEWRRSFAAFLRDMGRRPDGMTLDRINPAGDYEPANCRWLDAAENSRLGGLNSPGSGIPIMGFETRLSASLALGGASDLVRSRVRGGWCEEHAATLPKASRRPADCPDCNAKGGA